MTDDIQDLIRTLRAFPTEIEGRAADVIESLLADNTAKVERMAELEAQRRRWEVIAKSRAETIQILRGAS